MWVLSDHDQKRHRDRFGSDERARAAALLRLTMRGTPFLYAGEELGLGNADVPEDRVVDPRPLRESTAGVVLGSVSRCLARKSAWMELT